MIKIVIEKLEVVTKTVSKSFLVKETPVPNTRGYGDRTDTEKVYETREVPDSETKTTKLLEQEIADDSEFNLAAVVKAINNLDRSDAVSFVQGKVY